MNANQISKALSEHRGDITRTVSAMLRHSSLYGTHNVEDAVQDACIHLMRISLPAYDASKGASVKTFIVAQTRNSVVDFMRYHFRRPAVDVKGLESALTEVTESPIASPEQLAGVSIDAARMYAAMESLKDHDKAMAYALIKHDTDYEAGASLGWNKVRAYRSKVRIVKALRRELT